ncbi:hypothetical protein K1719_033803 [Acacia pycnantha]|nr:hypothetical protein K1719_033803 [Acacia pycnantha]
MGFDSVRIIPSMGQSGGLVAAWNSSRISVSVLEEDRQYFHLYCQSPKSVPFFVTTMYAIPYNNYKSLLWGNLLRLSQSISDPWSVIEDFNDILTANERSGGRGGSIGRMQWFQDRINECRLVDLGAVGPRMTWKGPRIAGCSRLYESSNDNWKN